MKHLLNNISKEEKKSILEQHGGGMKIFNENFHKMVNKKLGHVDLYEQTETTDNSSPYSSKKISELTPEDVDKVKSSNSDVWASKVGNNVSYSNQSYPKDYLTNLLSSLNLFVIDMASKMTSLNMDEAVNRVLNQLPQYFTNDNASKFLDNYSQLRDKNLPYVQKLVNSADGLKLVKEVALANYNHNKTRTGAV